MQLFDKNFTKLQNDYNALKQQYSALSEDNAKLRSKYNEN